MKIRSLLVLSAGFALSLVRVCAAGIDEDAAAFNKLAAGIIAHAVSGSVDVASVEADVIKMESIAADFAARYKTKYPAGAKLMDFMLAHKDGLNSMSLADIDAQFESESINKAHGAELGLDLTAEENEHFGNPVDMFVHPATALICARLWAADKKEEHLGRIKSELQEVTEHCAHVVQNLKK